MIVNSHDGLLRCVTQSDHAHLAADLLSLWVTDGLPEHPRRRELLLAAREHDNGWQEADSAPFHDPATGRPHDFMTMPSAERRRIWLRGPRRHAEREPYASLLITRHARELHADHADDPEWADAFASWRSLEDELYAATGADASTVEGDYRWIDLSDVLSLAACGGLDRPFERYGFRGELVDGELAIDPFPLAGATTLRVPCRDVPARRYASDADLAMELVSARWRQLAVRVVAP